MTSLTTKAWYSLQGTAIFAALASPYAVSMINQYVRNPMMVLLVQCILFFAAVLGLMYVGNQEQ